jgi:hypothetical protein
MQMRTYIIGDLPLRSKSLARLLDVPGVTRVPPVRLGQEDVGSLADQQLAELLYGRPLSLGEVGCVLAHRNAYCLADSSPHEWALVFEDDAEVPRQAVPMIAASPLSDVLDQPSIISLFSFSFVPRTPAFAARSPFRRQWVPPSTTTAYLINRKAWSVALAAPPTVVSSADWPPWSMTVRFYSMSRDTGISTQAPSTIHDRPMKMSTSRLKRSGQLALGSTYRATRAFFPSRTSVVRWYAVSPLRRILGQASSSTKVGARRC